MFKLNFQNTRIYTRDGLRTKLSARMRERKVIIGTHRLSRSEFSVVGTWSEEIDARLSVAACLIRSLTRASGEEEEAMHQIVNRLTGC